MFQLLINGFALGLIASPSCPSNAEEIRLGTKHGLKSALTVGFGAVTGDAAVLLVLLLGVAPLIEQVQALSIGLWFIGALVLAYVAWGIFEEAAIVDDLVWAAQGVPESDADSDSLLRAFWVGFAITTFNPFTLVWWLGLLSPVLAEGQALPILFPTAVLLGSLAWFATLAFLLHWGRRWLTRRARRWVLIASGLAAAGYALYFLWQGTLELGLPALIA